MHSEVFDAVYCINLDRRPDRWERFRNQVPTDWPFRDIQRVSAIDGRRAPPPDWWKQGGGAWGCYRTHLHIMEKALNEGQNSILILEDDAIFCGDFVRCSIEYINALPKNWGMAYLGGQHLFATDHPPERVNSHVFKAFNINRTHAYALRGQMLGRVYRHLCRKDWDIKHHLDHHLGVFHQHSTEPIFCPDKWLVGQDEGNSNICGKNAPRRFWPHASAVAAVKPEAEPFVAVIGLHSSGSSCLAGVLHHLGLHLGNQLGGFYGTRPEANRCGFEATGLRDVCEAAIPFPSCDYALDESVIISRLQRWINGRRREAAAKQTIAGGKYPQLSRLGRELQEICGEQLKLVVSDRPLDVSIKSLQRRCPTIESSQIAAHQEWLEEGKKELLEQVPDDRKLIVPYDRLLENPLVECERLASFLNLRLTEPMRIAVKHWVDQGKRHLVSELSVATSSSDMTIDAEQDIATVADR